MGCISSKNNNNKESKEVTKKDDEWPISSYHNKDGKLIDLYSNFNITNPFSRPSSNPRPLAAIPEKPTTKISL